MSHVAQWDIRVHLFEQDDDTAARVVLDTGSNTLRGEGRAHRNQGDPQVPEIGDELAVGRALIHLGSQLVAAAVGDSSAMG